MADINLCNDLIRGINPGCDGLIKEGGTDKTVYLILKSNVAFTYDSEGYIDSITPSLVGSVPGKLLKFTGKDDKNSWATPLTPGENINTFNHTVILALYYSTPTELDTIVKLANALKLLVIMQNNDGTIVVLGADKGIKASAGEGGSGILINDSTAYTFTLTGEQRFKEKYFRKAGNTSNDLATNLAYLDSISTY